MSQGYECDRCGSLNSGKPHSRIELGDGIPRERPRTFRDNREVKEGEPFFDETQIYDVCPGCRSEFEEWWGDE